MQLFFAPNENSGYRSEGAQPQEPGVAVGKLLIQALSELNRGIKSYFRYFKTWNETVSSRRYHPVIALSFS